MQLEKELNCIAIIVAAGKGKRFGGDISKQFIKIKEKTILEYTLRQFELCPEINKIIVVTSKEYLGYVQKEIVNKCRFIKPIDVVLGGKERQDSVYNGLKFIDTNPDIVLVHDGVRPFVEISDIQKVIYSSYENIGCILAVQVKDTIKICNSNGFVVSTLKRDELWSIQTPQGFKYDVLMKAYEQAIKDGFVGSDDSVLLERLGYNIKIEKGSYKNIKITTIEDLEIAKNYIK